MNKKIDTYEAKSFEYEIIVSEGTDKEEEPITVPVEGGVSATSAEAKNAVAEEEEEESNEDTRNILIAVFVSMAVLFTIAFAIMMR